MSAPPVAASNTEEEKRGRGLARFLPWLGLGLLAWVLSRFDFAALRAAFDRTEPVAVVEAALFFACNLAVKAWRWQRMLAVQGLVLPPRVALAAFFSSQFYGQVTLGRVGELSRAEALTERGVPLGTALSSSVYDRVLDLAVVLVLAASLSARVLGDRRTAFVALAGMALVLGSGVFVLRAPALAKLTFVRRLRTSLVARRGSRGLLGMLSQLLAGFGPLLKPLFLLEATFWTGVAWLLYFASLWELARGMGLSASRLALTTGASLGALSALLPVTISGLGAREVIFMNVLGREHVPGSRAVVLSLTHLAVMSLVAIGLGLCATVVRGRQRRRYAAASEHAG